jgi:uroporphyrinogen decarboxylase
MIAGEGSSDQAEAKLFALTQPDKFATLIDLLIEASADYLAAQLSAGADLVQIFESWSANLDEQSFRSWVIEPTKKLVARLREIIAGATIIGFPRGAGAMLTNYAAETGVDCIGLDQMTPLDFARDRVALPLQGNLDPVRLRAGGDAMAARVDDIIHAFAGRPHIFNLGHGILPDTPIGHVEELVRRVRGR